MASPAGPYKTAQETALRASSALAVAMGGAVRIYTEVPTGAVLPYIVLGNDQVLIVNDECAANAEVFATIGVWSKTSPLDKGAQARAIGAAIIAALNLQLTVTGWDVDEWEVTSERYSTDPDQSTHGTIELHYLLTEQVA